MKVLITGSSGFIGKNLQSANQRKYTLLTPSSSELDLRDDIAVKNYFSRHKINVVIHCAVVGGSRPEEKIDNSLEDNLRIFLNLLKYRKPSTKFINLGSGAEYDKSKPIISIKEDNFGSSIPKDDYGIYKFICSQMIQRKNNCLNLRLFGVFGKNEDYRYRFISYAICRNILNLPIIINQNVFFDYVYIGDLIKIIDYFIHNDSKYKQYNIGSGSKIDLITIANKINKVSSHESRIIVRKNGLNNEYTSNNRRLMSELKNFRFTNFDKSLQELYNWYKININKIRMDDILKSPK